MGFAAKGTWFEIEEEVQVGTTPENLKWETQFIGYDIYKDPITDDGTKKSLKGLLAVHKDEKGEYYVKTQCTPEEEKEGYLQVIYEDGKFFNTTTLKEIRERIKEIS